MTGRGDAEGSEPALDALARDLASGRITRRSALRRLFAGAAGSAFAAFAPGAPNAGGVCPEDRKCNGDCCPKGSKCKNGDCRCTKPNHKICRGECVDLASSERHCGSCKRRCDNDERCVNGRCECRDGLKKCGGKCVDTRSDPNNCGTCDNVCASGNCQSGLCAGP